MVILGVGFPKLACNDHCATIIETVTQSGGSMQTLNIREIRNALAHLDELLNSTDEIIVTKHGEAIARILPMRGKHVRPTHEELHRLTRKLSVPSEKILRNERDDR